MTRRVIPCAEVRKWDLITIHFEDEPRGRVHEARQDSDGDWNFIGYTREGRFFWWVTDRHSVVVDNDEYKRVRL